jgi:hypothetical protein
MTWAQSMERLELPREAFVFWARRIVRQTIAVCRHFQIKNNRRQDTIPAHIEQFRTLCGEAAVRH